MKFTNHSTSGKVTPLSNRWYCAANGTGRGRSFCSQYNIHPIMDMLTSLRRNPVREFPIAKGYTNQLQSVNSSLGLYHRGVWNQLVGR